MHSFDKFVIIKSELLKIFTLSRMLFKEPNFTIKVLFLANSIHVDLLKTHFINRYFVGLQFLKTSFLGLKQTRGAEGVVVNIAAMCR